MTSIVGNHHIYDTVQVRLYFVVPGAFQRLNNILESRDIPAAGPTAQPPNGSGDALQSIQAGPLAPATAPTASAQLGTPTNHSMENNSIALKPTPAMTSEEFQIPDTSGSPNPTFLEWTPSEVAALTQLCDDQTRLHDWPQISLQLAHMNEEGDLNPDLRQLRQARSPEEIRRKMEGIPKRCTWTQAETTHVMDLVQEQEGAPINWQDIAAKLEHANENGALNPELYHAGRTRSAAQVRLKVSPLLKHQQAGAFAYTPTIGRAPSSYMPHLCDSRHDVAEPGPVNRACTVWTEAETACFMRLVQEQEGDRRNWQDIAAKLEHENEKGALNPELYHAGRTRSAAVCNKKFLHYKRTRSPTTCPFSDITNKLHKGTRNREPTTKAQENC